MTDACTSFLNAWTEGKDIPTKSGAPPALLSAFTKLLTDPTIPAIDLAREAVNPLPREHAYAPEPKPPMAEILYAMLIDAVKNLTGMNNRLVDFTEALAGSPGGEGGYKNLDGLAMAIDEFSWGHITFPIPLASSFSLWPNTSNDQSTTEAVLGNKTAKHGSI